MSAVPASVASLVYGILVVDRHPEPSGFYVLVSTRFAFWPLIVLGLVLLVFGISNVVRFPGNPAGKFVGLIYVVTAVVGLVLVWQGVLVRTA